MGPNEMRIIGSWISQVLRAPDDTQLKSSVHAEIIEFCKDFPIYKSKG
jgi:glycine/serine hydroxymethyltransferase